MSLCVHEGAERAHTQAQATQGTHARTAHSERGHAARQRRCAARGRGSSAKVCMSPGLLFPLALRHTTPPASAHTSIIRRPPQAYTHSAHAACSEQAQAESGAHTRARGAMPLSHTTHTELHSLVVLLPESTWPQMTICVGVQVVRVRAACAASCTRVRECVCAGCCRLPPHAHMPTHTCSPVHLPTGESCRQPS